MINKLWRFENECQRLFKRDFMKAPKEVRISYMYKHLMSSIHGIVKINNGCVVGCVYFSKLTLKFYNTIQSNPNWPLTRKL